MSLFSNILYLIASCIQLTIILSLPFFFFKMLKYYSTLLALALLPWGSVFASPLDKVQSEATSIGEHLKRRYDLPPSVHFNQYDQQCRGDFAKDQKDKPGGAVFKCSALPTGIQARGKLNVNGKDYYTPWFFAAGNYWTDVPKDEAGTLSMEYGVRESALSGICETTLTRETPCPRINIRCVKMDKWFKARGVGNYYYGTEETNWLSGPFEWPQSTDQGKRVLTFRLRQQSGN